MTTKRRRSSRINKFPCPFTYCGVILQSEAAIKTHEAAHNADKPLVCSVKGCSERFATVADREAHVRAMHVKRQSLRNVNPVNDSILAVGDEPVLFSQDTVTTQEGEPQQDDKDIQRDAEEIVTNAEYLASQMRIARVRCLFFISYMCIVLLLDGR